ncbi:putative linoleate 13S-lipoxygenase [Medicago truncatula]|uniref:Linoleate lipoxygenase n=1 Tax=Medicago truncatula TaxID=3880 RepID=A0A072U448_MEDTR|nr:linoleate lipoxygenase [Medicago truncatula]RHN49276.1 putative linoleate 13S-lipoxygenase [Medicago truncatula]
MNLWQILRRLFLKTVAAQLQILVGVSLIEILSAHSSDEVYLGERDTKHWIYDAEPLEAFDKFGKKLKEMMLDSKIELERLKCNKLCFIQEVKVD